MGTMLVWDRYPLAHSARIAERTVTAELAAAGGDFEAAVAALEQAVAIEGSIPYDEPPGWHAPVRQTLGAILLQAGAAADTRAHAGAGDGVGLRATAAEIERTAVADNFRNAIELETAVGQFKIVLRRQPGKIHHALPRRGTHPVGHHQTAHQAAGDGIDIQDIERRRISLLGPQRTHALNIRERDLNITLSETACARLQRPQGIGRQIARQNTVTARATLDFQVKRRIQLGFRQPGVSSRS